MGTKPEREIMFSYCAANLIKPNRSQNSASIFEEILIFITTTCTKKNGSVATLGTLGVKNQNLPKRL